MYEKILLPLDCSALAEVAVPYAEELAGRLDSEVTLVYVNELTNDPHQHLRKAYMDKMVETTKQGAEKHAEKSERRGTLVKSVILAGNPAEEIVDYAEKADVGLIVMATHGQSGIKRWDLGSVADKVVRATNRPVYLIRAKGVRSDVSEKGVLRKMLVSLDGSKVSEVVIPYVEELASRLKVEVQLVQVLGTGHPGFKGGKYHYIVYTKAEIEANKEVAQNYFNTIGTRLKDKGMIVKTEVRFGNPAEEIINSAKQTCADLVAMSTHGLAGLGRTVLGSVAERVLHEGTTPLLLVRGA